MAESRSDIDAIARGEHQNPFSFLGMHAEPGGSDLRVRAFVPGASSVAVIAPNRAQPLALLSTLHPEGVFAGTVKGRKRPCPYRLRVTREGREYEMEDCYRFGPALGELDLHLLTEGRHQRAYQKLGANLIELEGVSGFVFVVWAPNARRVSLVGDFNGWDGRCHPMRKHHDAGLWELFMPEMSPGTVYKYEILDGSNRLLPLKADPFARRSEASPGTSSVTWDSSAYHWSDADWMATRGASADRQAPMSIYEVHLGSWKRVDGDTRYLGYRELAEQLVPYVAELGFTHIELLPVTEHPFDGSWGYQPIGLYAPTSRFGTPDEFRLFVDRCHQLGIGVIMDWVPAHFPDDPHGLVRFDGTALYEHQDPRKGRHEDWGTLIYNFGRREVANFLISNALFWSEQYHVDGLRVDAVASMLYLDYSRDPGDWVPNEYGGNENIEAIAFLRQLNELVYGLEEGAFTTAEESTAWPMVSRPVYLGGLGFGYKWNMGWMHDTLNYMNHDPIHRRHHHSNLTFGLLYAFSENFILPLSHDEVVHGKGSLLTKMPGDQWQQFANLRLYYAFMYAHPGKKLLFMGAEIAQLREWDHDRSLDWHLLDRPLHAGVHRLVRDLNMLYRETLSLHQLDCEPQGFAWIDGGDIENSVISFLRASAQDHYMIVICNFTPVVRHGYRIGVPAGGAYLERLNTDAGYYGGSDVGNGGRIEATAFPCHGHDYSLCLTLPPLGVLYLEPAQPGAAKETL